MKQTKSRDRHLDTSAALDFLEQRLNATDRARVEEHLGRPCSACRERVRSLGEILATMRSDRVGEVPSFLHDQAVAVFVPKAELIAAAMIAVISSFFISVCRGCCGFGLIRKQTRFGCQLHCCCGYERYCNSRDFRLTGSRRTMGSDGVKVASTVEPQCGHLAVTVGIGAINSSDISLVQSKSGTILPTPP